MGKKKENAIVVSEKEALEAKFNAAVDDAARDEIYMSINSKLNDDRSVGRPKFSKNHSYVYVSDQLAFFKDSKGVEHPYVEVTFRDTKTQLTTSTSIGFWRKSVPQKVGPCKGNTYLNTKCDGLGSSDLEVLHALRTGIEIQCTDQNQVDAGLTYSDTGGVKQWVGKLNGKTWIYNFEVVA